MSETANWDGLGVFWTAFASGWTALLIAGMAFLHRRRHMPILRIRGLPLSFCAILFLHAYWLAVQLGYVYGHLMPNGVEYWIMGIYFPFGVALFHASNSQFLHVAKRQKKYAQLALPAGSGKKPGQHQRQQHQQQQLAKKKTSSSKWPLVGKFRRYDYTTKMLAVVCAGMTFQFALTLVMYLVSRKFHPSFGIPGTEVTGTPDEVKREQGRGWEWWPSVFWQIFWAWMVAPYILWQSRGIHDTQGWRVQTVACCLVSLHAAPMWLIALYVDGMGVINQYFIPPQWIAVSIMFMEIFTIFTPCWQVLRHQSLRQETLELIALWETGRKSGSGKSFASDSTRVGGSGKETYLSWKHMGEAERGGSIDAMTAAGGGLLTMDALEYALKKNPGPLQHFSALKDFSGENIAFLTAVLRWKTNLRAHQNAGAPASLVGSSSPAEAQRKRQREERDREMFNEALRIYTEFISPRDAEFSINISSSDLKRIEAVFESAARTLYGDERRSKDSATPFDDWGAPKSSSASEKGIVHGDGDGDVDMSDAGSTIAERVYYWGRIPEGFDETVFDEAETSIKYLVLTNTWPRFVRDRRTSFDSTESVESYDTLLDMVAKRGQTGK
ncbi:hypothetical protein SODALDRAFT_268690 [Sodiomyces alkalinus F11]|uniref:Uncharacterized protein n=1 Tax=Sodiomyces alkalinus (strain CBS 110278 / VKM F-3762 / F11) TaxID=1314773 RepID=A0A3N2Q5K3_SODAK|nr:hypothetical protein SODALDRAFT_268690 [Sodiomyces alkalinus F11]ROT41977.1 hypothetical protein SODALDRAFT_268690 [Sodiomyces alkalinus F11]